MEYPNKIYVSEYKGLDSFGYKSHFVIVVVASDKTVAKEYIKEKIGIDVEPVWLMGAVHPTLYIQDGSKPS